jgi:hypothetical protein
LKNLNRLYLKESDSENDKINVLLKYHLFFSEYALIGSTEFTELHYQKLTSRAVAYLNVDIAVSGTDYFDPSGTNFFKEFETLQSTEPLKFLVLGTPNLWRFLINTASRVHHLNNPEYFLFFIC